MPKKFKFRLEPVLRYRRHQEEEKKRTLGEARRLVVEKNEDLVRLFRNEEEQKQAISHRRKEKQLNLVQMRLQEQYLNALARQIREAYIELQQRMQAEDRARQELAEAAKKVRVLERLRTKRLMDYRYDLSMEERKELDEIGARRAWWAEGEAS